MKENSCYQKESELRDRMKDHQQKQNARRSKRTFEDNSPKDLLVSEESVGLGRISKRKFLKDDGTQMTICNHLQDVTQIFRGRGGASQELDLSEDHHSEVDLRDQRRREKEEKRSEKGG